MSTVRLHLIGGFELDVDDEPIPLQPAMQRLLALVALTERGVKRVCAAMQLWPDHHEDRAKANLRSTLWRLRRLPVELLSCTKTRLRLADTVWIDARHGVTELNGPEPRDPFNHALPHGSLMGDLLPDWYDDWLVIERERIRQQHLGALERHARTALEDGRNADAIQLGLSAASLDPVRESSHRVVIEAQLREGNGSDARRTYCTYRDRLLNEEGLEPSAELRSLVEPASPVAPTI